MIKKLKFQIAFTISFILSFVLVLLLFTVNILNYSRSLEESYNSLEIVASSSGEKIWGSISSDVEESENQAAFRSSQFFSVLFDKEGEIIVLKNHQDSGYSDDELAALAGEIFRSGIMRGSRGYLLFTAKKYVGGTLIVFMDNSISQRNIRTMQSNSLMIGCLGIAVIGWISYALACWLVLPVKETFEKQKSFISDASHELKTPIAVISANVDVLEDDVGSNKWLQYIKTETAQMNGLISNLLMLSKIDSTEERPVFSRFNMSKTVEGAAMPFECIAFEKGVLIECNPGENIMVTGSEERVKQVVAILIDNAIKYVYENGRIEVLLHQQRGRAVLEVSNTGDPIPKSERKKIFERFYRVDKSRSRENGSYGLGLAIAKSIVDMHGGNISVECNDGWTKFKVVL